MDLIVPDRRFRSKKARSILDQAASTRWYYDDEFQADSAKGKVRLNVPFCDLRDEEKEFVSQARAAIFRRGRDQEI